MESLRALAANFDDLRVLLLFYWVEGSFIAYTGLSLLGIKLNLKRVIPIGLTHGLMIFLVRGIYKTLEIPFGTHTLILIFTMVTLLVKIGRIRPGIAVNAALLGIVLLVLGEAVTMPFFYKAMNMPVEQIWINPWTHILAGYVGNSLIILMALITSRTNFSLLKLDN